MDSMGKAGDAVGRLMDLAAARQRAVAKNIANAETPGYRAVGARFAEDLAEAVRSGDADQVAGVRIETFDRNTPEGKDGNTVDMETETGELTRNTLSYQTLVAVVNLRHAQMRAAISGRS